MNFLLFVSPATAADDARAVLDRAIRAHGGEERLARTIRGHVKAVTEGKLGGNSFLVDLEETFDLPGRYHRIVTGVAFGGFVRLEYGIRGEAGWLRRGDGPAQDFPVQPRPPERYWHAVLFQLLRLRDKDVQLTLLAEAPKGTRGLVGIRAVTSQATGELYFDRATGLLARARRPLPDLMGGREQVGENVLENYREVDGVRYPMRLKADAGDAGSFTVTVSSLQFLDAVDDRLFVKPPPAATPDPLEAEGEPETVPRGDEQPARSNVRLIAATLIGGAVVGAVWLAVRLSSRRKQGTPPG